MKKNKGLIVALDVDTSLVAKSLVRRLGCAVDFYKLPPALCLRAPGLISWLKAQGKKIFLDFKWYDIPSQVARSVKEAGRFGATACTVHVGAGRDVLKAAVSVRPRPRIWGVTVLTSLGGTDLKAVGVPGSVSRQVLRLARLACSIPLDGLVCSPHELVFLRKNGIRLPLITPGIQFGGMKTRDQKRTAAPGEAWSAGADWIVVGRAIVKAKNPRAVVNKILKEKAC